MQICTHADTFTLRVPHDMKQSAPGVVKILEDWCLAHVFCDFRVCILMCLLYKRVHCIYVYKFCAHIKFIGM